MALLEALAMLAIGGDAEAVERIALPPGHLYRLRKLTATADAPFCVSLIAESAPLPTRALALGCFESGGTHAFSFHEPPVAGDWRRSYTVVAWPPAAGGAPTTVLVKTEIAKEKP